MSLQDWQDAFREIEIEQIVVGTVEAVTFASAGGSEHLCRVCGHLTVCVHKREWLCEPCARWAAKAESR